MLNVGCGIGEVLFKSSMGSGMCNKIDDIVDDGNGGDIQHVGSGIGEH